MDQGADTCRPGLLVNIVDMRCMAVWNKMYLFPGRQELHGRTLYYININIIMFKCSVIFLRMEFVNDSFHVGCRSRFIDTISCINNTIIPQCHIRFHDYISRCSLNALVLRFRETDSLLLYLSTHVTLLFPFVNIMMLIV